MRREKNLNWVGGREGGEEEIATDIEFMKWARNGVALKDVER